MRENPGYVTDQGFPNNVKGSGEEIPLVDGKWKILLEADFFIRWWALDEECI